MDANSEIQGKTLGTGTVHTYYPDRTKASGHLARESGQLVAGPVDGSNDPFLRWVPSVALLANQIPREGGRGVGNGSSGRWRSILSQRNHIAWEEATSTHCIFAPYYSVFLKKALRA